MKTASQRGWVGPAGIRRALRALGGVIEDPNRTDLVGEFIGSLTGPSALRLFERSWEDPVGRRLLAEGRDLSATLRDRRALAALPPGSLGRTYHEWTANRDFTAEGIAGAIEGQVSRDFATPQATLGARVVDMHDLWHVLNGWDSDIHGEIHLLGYSYAQLGGIAWLRLGLLACLALALGGRTEAIGYLRSAIRRGRKARLLAAVDWEAMLPLPLDEVRRRLGVAEPVPYRKLGFAEAERARAANPFLRAMKAVLPS